MNEDLVVTEVEAAIEENPELVLLEEEEAKEVKPTLPTGRQEEVKTDKKIVKPTAVIREPNKNNGIRSTMGLFSR